MPGTVSGAQNGSVNKPNPSSKNLQSRAGDRHKQGSQYISQFYIVTNSRKKMKWRSITRSGRMKSVTLSWGARECLGGDI